MYKGELTGFPIEVVEKMLEYQVKQGNPKNVIVFENLSTCDVVAGGFDWEKTTEGREFWEAVIADRFFGLFFEMYPNKQIKVQHYIDYMIDNKINMLVWRWEDCPLDEKYELDHGGDEDTVILWKYNDLMMESAINGLTVCDRNMKSYGDFELTVTAHA